MSEKVLIGQVIKLLITSPIDLPKSYKRIQEAYSKEVTSKCPKGH